MNFHIEITRKDPDACELKMKNLSKNGFNTIEQVIAAIKEAFQFQNHITRKDVILDVMEKHNSCIIFIINKRYTSSEFKEMYQIELMTTEKREEIIREKNKANKEVIFPALGPLPKYATDIIRTKQYHKN